MRARGGSRLITVDDTFQAWAEQEDLDPNHRFIPMINGKVVKNTDAVLDGELYFIPQLSAAAPKRKRVAAAGAAEAAAGTEAADDENSLVIAPCCVPPYVTYVTD